MMTNEFPALETFEEEWLLKNYSREKLKDKSYHELLSLLPRPERSYGDVMAASVIELRSISLRDADCDNDKVYAIYGTIHLVDGDGVTFVLYDRKHDNPETISNGGVLAITLPTDRVMNATGLTKLHIDLKDEDGSLNGADIIKGVFDWDCTAKEDRYDDVLHTEVFQSQGVSVAVEFDLYPHAVVCNVAVEVLTDFKGVNVYGEIVARAGKSSTPLFDRKPNDSVNFDSGTYVPLSRSVVIAPALSPMLNIHVSFSNADNLEKIFEETIPFAIWICNGYKKYGGERGLVKAQVKWNHPCCQPHFSRQAPPTFSEAVNNNSKYPCPFGPKLLEIYSVSIVGNRAQDMDIWGSIKLVRSGVGEVLLFNKEDSSPQKLLPGQILPLLSYTVGLLCNAFTLNVELRDASHRDRSISWGEITWDCRDYIQYIAMMGWQLCSVVRSANGYYAAVHYSLFNAGIQAIVKIYLSDKNLDTKYFRADGTVYAGYNDYDYSTAYQKEYYRKQLFSSRKSSEPLLPYSFYTVLLSESSVLVPEGSTLMLDVHVDATSSSSSTTLGEGSSTSQLLGDSFVELVEFKPDDINLPSNKHVHRRIDGSSMQLFIQVEWREMN